MMFFQLFSNHPDIRTVAAGKELFAEGDPGRCMYVLVSGSAEVIVRNQVAEEIVAGDVIGEAGLVAAVPRSTTVMARTDCLFIEIDEERFHFLVRETPKFATRVMRVMAERLLTEDARASSSLLAEA